MKPGKKFFISLQVLFLFSKKSYFNILDIYISWRHRKNTFYWINNLISKHSLWMKFGQFVVLQNNFIKNFNKNCEPKTSSRSFCVCKELSLTSIGKWNFWSKLLILDISKTIKIFPNHHTDLFWFLFTEDSLKIKKGLALVSRPHFSLDFFIKNFLQ